MLKRELQIKYCTDNDKPMLAPVQCYHCNKDPLEKYTEEECATDMITGCRHCHRSFVG